MAHTATLYNGKTKSQIAEEAFKKLGPEATKEQVDAYFVREYGIPECEPSMFWVARGKAKRKAGIPTKGRIDNENLPPTTNDKSKTEHIRDVFNEGGMNLTDREVLQRLAKKGVSVHPKSVYDVRRNLTAGKKRNKRKKKVKEKPVTTTSPPATEKKPAIAGVTLDDARAAKALCDQVGLTNVKAVLEGIGQMSLTTFRKAVDLLETLQLNAPMPEPSTPIVAQK